MGILVRNVVLALLAEGVKGLSHTQHIHRGVVEKVQLGIGFHHIVVDGGPAHQQLVPEGMKAGDGGLGQPPHLLTGLQGGGVLGFIVDEEQPPAGQLDDFLDMPLVILHPPQGNQNKVAEIDPPQVFWGTDDLVGDLVLCQKGRPGGFDGDGGGNHKDIIGLPVGQPVHPLGGAGYRFPGPLGPLEVGVPHLKGEVGVAELPLVEADGVPAPPVGQLPALQPLPNLRGLCHLREGDSLVAVLPLLFLQEFSIRAISPKVHHAAGCHDLGNLLYPHVCVTGRCLRLDPAGIGFIVKAPLSLYQRHPVLPYTILHPQDLANTRHHRLVVQAGGFLLLLLHIQRAFLVVILLQ